MKCKAKSLTELKKKLSDKGYKNLRVQKRYEGRKLINLVTAQAKKNTPYDQKALSSLGKKNPRVHVGTFVPSSKTSFLLPSKYAVKRRMKK